MAEVELSGDVIAFPTTGRDASVPTGRERITVASLDGQSPRSAPGPRRDGLMLPSSLSGRFRVDAELGTGSQARVVRAWDGLLHRDVAIKLVPVLHASRGALARQEQEAQLLAALNHHALTTLYDVGTDRTDPDEPLAYLVMEYVRGPDLEQRLELGALDPLQVCWLGYDLCDALDHLHGTGFLHRDIKPANVLLIDRGMDVRVRGKLTDFGISSLTGGPSTPGRVTGTAAYIAPEQLEDLPATEASDVYSLGLVLLEALTGARAFPGPPVASAVARLERHAEVPDRVPPRLAALLRSMTARWPGARPTAAQAAARFGDLAIEQLARPREPGVDRETARLAAVQRYHILDTPPEDAFDALTALASRVLHAPLAVLSIVDADRIWFKSRHAVDEPEIDRDGALRLHGADGRAWSTRDATTDPRTRDHALVTSGPGVRGYAAAPLRTHDGHDIGALCVLDPRPHDFTPEDLAVLTSLAAVVMRELELRLASRRAVFNRRAADPPADAAPVGTRRSPRRPTLEAAPSIGREAEPAPAATPACPVDGAPLVARALAQPGRTRVCPTCGTWWP